MEFYLMNAKEKYITKTGICRSAERILLCLFIFPLILLFQQCFSFPKIIIHRDVLSAEEHNDLGLAYLNENKLEYAEIEFKKAVKKKKKFPEALYNLGNLYYLKGDLNGAENFFRRALRIDRNFPELLNNLAYVLYKKGEFREAKDLIERALLIKDTSVFRDTENKIKSSIENKSAK